MRKESLKKDGTKNGTVEEIEIDSDGVNETNDAANLNGDAVDPLDGADQANNLEVSKKKAKKGKEGVVEVILPTAVDATEAVSSADDGDYEVEEIISHKLEKKKKFYLVRWKNYGADSDTWEPEASLSCPELIKKYVDAHPDIVAVKKKKAEKKPESVPASKKPKRAAAEKAAIVEKEEDYEVEDIVDHKTEKGKNIFLIRWKGWSAEHDTWEPESTLSCPAIVSKYKKSNMAAPTKSKKTTSNKTAAPKSPKKVKADKDYEVQLIVDEKTEKGQKFYLVRWKGWSPESDTWEPESSLNCPDLIKKYKDGQSKKRPAAPKRGSTVKPKYTEIEEDVIEETRAPAKKRKAPEKEVAENYEVEDIVDHKTEKGQKFYLVKWKGWAAASNTWEPESSLSCPDIVKKYLANKTNKTTKGSTKAEKKEVKKPKTKTKTPKKSAKAAKSTKSAAAVEETDWEVEEIMDVKYNDDGTKDFLIRWKGCDSSSDTWEPESNLDCSALINKFMHKEDEVPKKKSRKA